MYNECKQNPWYGKLTTPSKSSIVIYDKGVSSSSSGKIPLYNTELNKITEYIENIVINLLSDLTPEEYDAAEKLYKKDWNKMFAEYRKMHPKILTGKVSKAPLVMYDEDGEDEDGEDEDGEDEDGEDGDCDIVLDED
jgi:hypothetical protein